jgi:rod shape-determining protein MreD
MKRTIHASVAVIVSLVAQSLLARVFGDARLYIDLPLVAVLYVALSGGRVAGLLAGTVAGLSQDAMSGGVLGIGGMSKSIAGFLGGIIGTQFIVTQMMPRVLVFMGGTIVNAVVFMGLYLMLGLRHFDRPWLDVLLQAASNGLVGAMVFAVVDFLPGAKERWRVRRDYRKRTRRR